MKKITINFEIVKSILHRAALVPAIGLLCYVFFYSLMDWGAAPFFNEKLSGGGRIFLTILGIGILFALFCLCVQMLHKISDKKLHIIGWILFGVFIIVQISYLVIMQVGLRYDALKTLDEAVSVLKTGSVSDQHLNGYFARYTNNYGILLLTVVLLKMFELLSLTGVEYVNATFLLGLINILFIDAGIIFTWKLGRKIKGEKGGILCLLFCLFQPLFIIWTPFYYTNTISMGLMMAGIYGIYCLLEEKNMGKKSYVYAFLTGIVLVAGFNIRATIIITVIACIIYILLNHINIEKTEIKNKIKMSLLNAGCMAAGAFLIIGSYSMLTKHYVPFDTTDTAFPAIHWIAMGAGEEGVYNILDEYYTMEHQTIQEKKEAGKQLFLSRIKELGISGYIRLLFHKLRITFSDGSGGYLSELGVSQKINPAHFYFLGGKSDFWGAYGAIYYSFCLLFVLVGEVIDFIRMKRSFIFIMQLNLLGAFLFHMMWEAGTIYSIGFMTLLPLCMVEGFESVKKAAKKAYLPIGAGSILILSVCFMLQISKFTKENYFTNEASVNQFLYQCKEVELLKKNRVYIQSFLAYKSFNSIAVRVRNVSGEENNSVYKISLLNEDYEEVATMEAEARECAAFDFIRMRFDDINVNKEEYYYIRIEKIAGRKRHGLTFLTYNTGNYDAYRYGSFLQRKKKADTGVPDESDFQKEAMRDLSFSVYDRKEAPYFN